MTKSTYRLLALALFLLAVRALGHDRGRCAVCHPIDVIAGRAA